MKLKEYVQVNYDDEKILIYYRDGIKICNTEENLSFIRELIQGIEKEMLLEKYKNFEDIIKMLNNHGFLTEFDSNENIPEQKLLCYLDQFDNNTPVKLYEQLKNATVCIVGVGGIGGNIVQMLLSSGIRKFILIDYDVVEYHNLNRQYLYSISDVGRIKTEVCKEKISLFDPSASCIIFNKKIENKEDLSNVIKNYDVDVIVSAADTPQNIGTIIQQVAKEKRCAFAAGSVGIDLGQYIFATNNQLDNYKQGKPLEGMKGIERKTIKGSFGPTNEIICSYMALDIIYYLLEQNTWSNGKMVYFDFCEKKLLSLD